MLDFLLLQSSSSSSIPSSILWFRFVLFCFVLGFVADVGTGIAFFFFELEIFLAISFLLGNFFSGGLIDCIVIRDLVWKKLMWGDRM